MTFVQHWSVLAGPGGGRGGEPDQPAGGGGRGGGGAVELYGQDQAGPGDQQACQTDYTWFGRDDKAVCTAGCVQFPLTASCPAGLSGESAASPAAGAAGAAPGGW